MSSSVEERSGKKRLRVSLMPSDCCVGFFSKARPRGGGGNGVAINLCRLSTGFIIGLMASSSICVRFPLIHTDRRLCCSVLADVVNRRNGLIFMFYEQLSLKY